MDDTNASFRVRELFHSVPSEVWSKLLARREDVYPGFGKGLAGCRSFVAFISTASAEDNFRSCCGSVRRPPVWSSHASLVAATQLGQGTDNVYFAASSLVFIPKIASNRYLECSIWPFLTCQLGNNSYSTPLGFLPHSVQK